MDFLVIVFLVLLHDFEVTTWAVLKCNKELISVSVDTDGHQYFKMLWLAVGLIHTCFDWAIVQVLTICVGRGEVRGFLVRHLDCVFHGLELIRIRHDAIY